MDKRRVMPRLENDIRQVADKPSQKNKGTGPCPLAAIQTMSGTVY